jgi:UDP-4-amino-4,6-dideoxy-N-acetyl-beta-L-altrosamine transaminase
VAAVCSVLRSDWLTTGPKVEEFEEAVAGYCGARYAIAVSNGTAALHVSALALDLKEGDEGITSPNTFLASAKCIAFCRSIPLFADIDPDTHCINPKEIKNAITPKTRVLIPVHFAGQPCDIETIQDIAAKEKLYIIEDAAHAIGASWEDSNRKWHKVGSCSHSHLTIFSFHPVKTITAGEGGMILTNDKDLADKCRLFRNHGIIRDPSKFVNANNPTPHAPCSPPFYYEMQELGYNYRLTDFQCALGIAQLRHLDDFVDNRREIWKYYNNELTGVDGFTTPVEREGVRSAWHLYVAQVERRDELFNYLRERNIVAHAMYIPVHRQPYYQKHFGYQKGDFPNAEAYFDKCLALPLFPTLKDSEAEYIVKTVKEFFQ